MFFRVMRLLVPALASVILFTACAPLVILNATNEQDKFAKTFSPPGDKSLIYVYLDEPGLNVAEYLVVDGRVAGILRPTFYLMSIVAPGGHRVGLGHTEAESILLDTEQGKTYFINAHVSCENGQSHAQLQLIDESTGRQRVLASNLANVRVFGIPLLNDKRSDSCALPAGKGQDGV